MLNFMYKISKSPLLLTMIIDILFQTPLSFYVYDWDGSNVIDDDFLGSAHFSFKEVIEICVIYKRF
jgi:hypothetical protein